MLSEILSKLISSSKKTQVQIARELGLSPQRWNYYVTGHREPDHETLCRIADYFNVSIDYLLGRDFVFPNSGHRIKAERLRQGYSEKQLADFLYISVEEYRAMEDEKKPVTDSQLVAIADFLCSSPDYLTGYYFTPVTGEKPPVNDEGLSDSRYNVITIRGRDGSVEHKRLTDEQLAALEGIINLMPDPPEDL